MAKRPAMLLYFADLRSNSNWRRCTWEAKGVWTEVMGLMHDSDEYGILRWPLKEISRAIGAPIKLVKELVGKGVMKGADEKHCCESYIYTPRSGRKDGPPVVLIEPQKGPIWYSSRMVKDEYKRTHAGASTRFKSSPSHGHGEDKGNGSGEDQSDGLTLSLSLSSISGGSGAREDSNLPDEAPREISDEQFAVGPMRNFMDLLGGLGFPNYKILNAKTIEMIKAWCVGNVKIDDARIEIARLNESLGGLPGHPTYYLTPVLRLNLIAKETQEKANAITVLPAKRTQPNSVVEQNLQWLAKRKAEEQNDN